MIRMRIQGAKKMKNFSIKAVDYYMFFKFKIFYEVF